MADTAAKLMDIYKHYQMTLTGYVAVGSLHIWTLVRFHMILEWPTALINYKGNLPHGG